MPVFGIDLTGQSRVTVFLISQIGPDRPGPIRLTRSDLSRPREVLVSYLGHHAAGHMGCNLPGALSSKPDFRLRYTVV